MTTPDPVRESFEKWAARRGFENFTRKTSVYANPQIDDLWSAWQAALSAPPPQVPLTDAQILQCAENEHLYGRAGSLLSFARKLLAASPPPNTPREE